MFSSAGSISRNKPDFCQKHGRFSPLPGQSVVFRGNNIPTASSLAARLPSLHFGAANRRSQTAVTIQFPDCLQKIFPVRKLKRAEARAQERGVYTASQFAYPQAGETIRKFVLATALVLALNAREQLDKVRTAPAPSGHRSATPLPPRMFGS